jgi:transposase
MVRRWISEARRAPKAPSTPPGFVPVNLPAVPSGPSNQSISDKSNTIRIEIPRAGGAVVVEWPVEQAHQCAALLRDLLG